MGQGNRGDFQKVITGSFTANAQTVAIDSPEQGTQILEVTGTWVGTLVVEGSNAGSTYYPLVILNNSTNLLTSSITASGSYTILSNGYQFVQVRSSAWTSGTATITVWGAEEISLGVHLALLKDGVGNPITSASNGNAGNQILHTQTPDTTTASTTLGALNATISIAMAGLASAGFQIAAGTLIGTLTPQCSLDGGATYVPCSFYDPANSTVASTLTFSSSNTLKVLSILPIGGSSHIQVKVTAYTSGTANSVMRASQVTGAAGAVTAAAYGNISNTFPAITNNTATLILAANVNRKYAYISNGSGSQVNIQFGSSTGLSNTTGIPIPAKSIYELKGDNLFTGNIYAFSGSSITLSLGEGTP